MKKNTVSLICLLLTITLSFQKAQAQEHTQPQAPRINKGDIRLIKEKLSILNKKNHLEHRYIPIFYRDGSIVQALSINSPQENKTYLRYDFLNESFPSKQDVYLEKQKNFFRLWFKTKSWVKSVALFGVLKNKETVFLKSVNPSMGEEDSRLFIHGKLSSNSEHFLASSAVLTLPKVGSVLRLNVPVLISYGGQDEDKIDTIFSFDKIEARFYEKEHGRGRYTYLEYDLKDRMNLVNNPPVLDNIAVLQRKKYNIIIYEYRSLSLGLRGLQVSENGEINKSLMKSNFFSHTGLPIKKEDNIKVLQWLFDTRTKETVLRFAVLVIKGSHPRNITTTVYIDSRHKIQADYFLDPEK